MSETKSVNVGRCSIPNALVLAAIILLSNVAESREIGLDELPAIPRSEMIAYQRLSPEELSVEFRIYLPQKSTFLEITRHAQETTRQCVRIMQHAGWELQKEDWFRRGGEFHFTREIINQVVMTIGPHTKAMGGIKRDFIKITFELKRMIPYTDLLGIDYPDIPRFPGSIRVRWMNLAGDYSVKYLVAGKTGEVENFFKQRLSGFGWQPSVGTATLNYSKGEYGSKATLPLKKQGVPQPKDNVKEMVSTTLGIHLHGNQGIVEIGIGRSSRTDASLSIEQLRITPERSLPPNKKESFVAIDPDKDIPIHPLLIQQHIERLPLDTQGNETFRRSFNTRKVAAAEAVNIAGFYLDKMKDAGWKILDDEWYGLGRTLVFQKGAVKVKTAVKAIGRWPISEQAPAINIPVEIDIIYSIPTREIAGKDIDDVPRFPGSVRFYYLEAGLDHTAKYKAWAAAEEVEWYFIEELTKSGWTFSGHDQTGLLFVPSYTTGSPAGTVSKRKLIPTTLKLKVDDMDNGTVKIGLTRTRGS
ncbi:MAG: hypothetical protein RB296_11940 [Acidobacteriota bacterium]|jgi:hypothetical protein|nr:hypothetical protein [Acidobacteriota bacterium]